MGVPIIFSGNNAKTLKPNIDLFGNVTINSGALDPTSSAVSANLGSLYISTSTGLIYQKLDNGSSTNWVVLGQGANVSNPVTFSPSIDGIGISSSSVTWSRDGAYMEIQGSVTSSSASGTNMAINLPNSAVVASSYDSTTYTAVGWGARDDSAAGDTKFIMAICRAGDSKVYLALASSPVGVSPLAPTAANSQIAPGQNFAFFIRVRIQGWLAATAVTRTAPKITTYTSGSGTHTLTGSPLYIRVRMVGGGGGGGGGGGTIATAGGTGGNTTFGSSLLVANGGGGGAPGTTGGGTGAGGSGGPASLGSGPSGEALPGGAGSYGTNGLSTGGGGPSGASSPFGGAGAGTETNGIGGDAVPNTGSGGGAGAGGSGLGYPGGSGGAGGYVNAVISSPAASYSYAVGAAGTAGSGNGGVNLGAAGGAGGSGMIIVEEYYQ